MPIRIAHALLSIAVAVAAANMPSLAQGVVWSRIAGTSNAEMIADISLDSRENIYLAGHGSPLKNGEQIGRDYALVMKFGPDGTWKWTREYKDRRTPEQFKAMEWYS